MKINYYYISIIDLCIISLGKRINSLSENAVLMIGNTNSSLLKNLQYYDNNISYYCIALSEVIALKLLRKITI